MMSWYRYESDSLILKLYIQPGAKRHEIIGPVQDELKIKLASPAIEGRANVALMKLLSQLFNVPRSKIVLKSGEKSRHKTVIINNSTLRPEDILMHQLK
jgi:uncharacterized protein (TIGR00251 family)